MQRNEPVLLILAAGLGSRYGGLKQVDGVGPNGETIMAYSIYDAVKAGFKRIVFVIGEAHQSLFETRILPQFRTAVSVKTVLQLSGNLPEGYCRASERRKPWGTGHAILAAWGHIRQPFAVINADDFYGAQAFAIMADRLRRMSVDDLEFFLLGYRLDHTLSEYGAVSRGVCRLENGYLSGVTEHTAIVRGENGITGLVDGRKWVMDPEAVVSMNFWGFTPKVFPLLDEHFRRFLKKSLHSDVDEFYITHPLDTAVRDKTIRIKMLPTTATWMGITYPEDKTKVVTAIRQLIDRGVYPSRLFGAETGLTPSRKGSLDQKNGGVNDN